MAVRTGNRFPLSLVASVAVAETKLALRVAPRVVRYLAQPDPEAGRPELSPTEPDDDDEGNDDAARVEVPSGAFTIDRLTAAVSWEAKNSSMPLGTTCHDRPNRSLHQPHGPSEPPSAVSLAQ